MNVLIAHHDDARDIAASAGASDVPSLGAALSFFWRFHSPKYRLEKMHSQNAKRHRTYNDKKSL